MAVSHSHSRAGADSGHDHGHGHDHTHGHGHVHGHDHAHGHAVPRGPSAERRLLAALALTAGFMVVEVAGGLYSGSLALLADAGHMLTDVAALALAWFGIRLGRKPADSRRGFGYRRLEVLAAFVNGITLIALTVWIAIEAAQRFMAPQPILTGAMLAIAVAGLAVNLASFAILRGGAKENLNVSGALAHVLGDLLGSLAAIAAALVIHFTGWLPIDPLLSLFIAGLVVRSGWLIVKRSTHILLEGTPEDMDAPTVAREIESVPGVVDVHHVHVWSLTSGQALATLHLRLAPGAQAVQVVPLVKTRLAERFGIRHSTVEIDFGEEECADCETR